MKTAINKKLTDTVLIVASITVITGLLYLLPVTDVLERKTIDSRTRWLRGDKALPDDIALIVIDEGSLEALDKMVGRWPWPRDIHAILFDFLRLGGAKAVVADLLFAEKERVEGDAPGLGPNDARLVESTALNQNVFFGFQMLQDASDPFNKKLLDQPMSPRFKERFALSVKANTTCKTHNNFHIPYNELAEVAKGAGVVTFSPDGDGVFRSEKLLFKYQDRFYPAFALAPILAEFSGDAAKNSITLNKGQLVISGARKTCRIPLQKDNSYYINMYGRYKQNEFSYSGVILSMLELEQGNVANLAVRPEEFKDKVVFIGGAAPGVEDYKNTAIATKTPGVYLHASAYANIMTGDYLRFAGRPVNLLIIMIITAITALSIFYAKNVFFKIVPPLSLFVCFLVIGSFVFVNGYVVNFATPCFAFLLTFITCFTHISTTEGRAKKKITRILGQYVSPAMLTAVLDSHTEDYFKAEVGTKENLTIFFSDIRGFTTISEKYPAEKVVELLNSYLSVMVNIIFENQGTLDKFIGDAIVAFWGAPIKLADHQYKAVLSAIQMIQALEAFNNANQNNEMPNLSIGIGIHTGDVILGNIGSEKKLDYTVIGDSVNLASRLEGLTKQYNCKTIITQDTYDNIQDLICCRMIDYVKVKGKDKPITIYEVLGEKETVDQETLLIAELTREGFTAYSKQQFEAAIAIFEKIFAYRPNEFLANMYIYRCKAYLKDPPAPDWDGYYVFKTK